MPALTRRLAQLENALKRGYLSAAIHIMYSDDPDGPGYRKTGEVILDESSCTRFTDDLCCVVCGQRGDELHIITIVGIGPDPVGRRLSPPIVSDSPAVELSVPGTSSPRRMGDGQATA